MRVFAAGFEESVKLVQPENNSKFLEELWDVSGLPLSWGPDTLRAALQTHLGCASGRAANEDEIAARLRLDSDQAP